MKKLKNYLDTFIQALMFGVGVSIGAVIVMAASKLL